MGSQAVNFGLDEAVTVHLPYRPGRPVERDELRVAPEMATFQGRKWLPVNRDVNLVRIGKCLFYVRSIAFGESKWRRASTARDKN
jgi:hypothetical protein